METRERKKLTPGQLISWANKLLHNSMTAKEREDLERRKIERQKFRDRQSRKWENRKAGNQWAVTK